MPTFQDARDGLDAILKDAKGNLSPDDKDKNIVNAARAYSRRRPRLLSKETDGDGGFEYALPTDFVNGFSSIQAVYFPWSTTDQNPVKLEPKDFTIFDGPSGSKFRFVRTTPSTTQKFLTQFTAPQTVETDPADEVGELSPAGTVVSGAGGTSTSVDVETAEDIQIFINVTAAAGANLEIIIQASDDEAEWTDIAAFNDITGICDKVRALPPEKVSKFVRLKYTTTGGSFTLEATVLQQGTSATFTIADHDMDAFNYLSASISAQALADFYSHLVDSELEGETTDYEGKAVFWQENASRWNTKWEKEIGKAGPRRGARASGQGEWDLVGTTKFPMLTHDERHR